MLDLHRLRLLREFHDRGTVAAVADALGYSPSAVSQQLRVLEVEAKARLLEREGRRIVLTAAGHVLVAHANQLLEGVERAESEVAAVQDDVGGTVRIAAFQSTIVTLVLPMLAELRREYPRLRIEVHQAEPQEALEALRRRDVDLVIADEYEYAPRASANTFIREDLLREPVRLASAAEHPLAAAATPVLLRSLANHAWVSGTSGSAHDQLLQRACRTHGGFTPDVRHRSDDLTGLLALIADGHVIGLLPDLVWRHGGGGVRVRDVGDGPLTRTVFTATRTAHAAHPATAAVQAALRKGVHPQ
ncbi:LysR substrate-binding domain-containing protein [Actinomycetes bacterium KLBMP 9759]